jgi:2-polyprenyl-3-methyl-5-hydroxy-6-metoxy-1,4-benzoquinol methylase
MDLSRLAIEFAPERTQEMDTQYHCTSASNLPYREEAFHGVISTQVIEHVDALAETLGEIFRVLKPGGFAITTTRVKLSEPPLDPAHIAE